MVSHINTLTILIFPDSGIYTTSTAIVLLLYLLVEYPTRERVQKKLWRVGDKGGQEGGEGESRPPSAEAANYSTQPENHLSNGHVISACTAHVRQAEVLRDSRGMGG